MNIVTSRLVISPVDEASLCYIFKHLKDISLNILVPRDSSMYHTKKFMMFNEKIKLFNSLGYFSIRLKRNSEVIGFVSVVPRYLKQNLVNELSYMVSEKYQNNNFASEVVFNVLDFIFSKTNIDRVYSLIEETNLVSKHILQNKMKFDFVDLIADSNTFKLVYTLDKVKFKYDIKPFNYC